MITAAESNLAVFSADDWTESEKGACFKLPCSAEAPILAVGGEGKVAPCIVTSGSAQLAPVIGNLNEVGRFRTFDRWMRERVGAWDGRAAVIAHDRHPGYLTTQWARGLGRTRSAAGTATALVPVQHHHAHVLACMAEHGEAEPVIGLACDGAGYGTDGAVWGCEVLHVTPLGFARRAHLRYFPLAGGDAAARECWRPALALLRQSIGEDLPDRVLELFRCIPHDRFLQVLGLLRGAGSVPMTSSLGRLFDAVAFLAGLADTNHAEAEAARLLEEAGGDGDGACYAYRLERGRDGLEIDVAGMIREIVREVSLGVPSWHIGRRFHATMGRALGEAAWTAARQCRVSTVVLTGGCFANRLLRDRVMEVLTGAGISRVLVHERTSCGDASLALGQAYAAAAQAGRAG